MSKKMLLIIPVLAMLLLAGTAWPDIIKVKVTKVETHKGVYLVFTEKGTLKNVDNWAFMKFDSSDLQGEIAGMVGKEVEIEKIGWRLSVFSMYENIISVKLLK